jgi:hypothetical protein
MARMQTLEPVLSSRFKGLARMVGNTPLLKRYEFSLSRMGTIFRMQLYPPDDASAVRAAERSVTSSRTKNAVRTFILLSPA